MVRKLSLGLRRRSSKASRDGSLSENIEKADIRASPSGISTSPDRGSGRVAKREIKTSAFSGRKSQAGNCCAAYVIEAIEAGGLRIARTPSGSAKSFGPSLLAAGFKAQPGDPVPYQQGDVAVIDGFSKTAAQNIKKD